MTTLSDDQVAAWRTDGYVIVPGLLAAEEVAAALADAHELFPTRAEYDGGGAPARLLGGGGEVTGEGVALGTLPFPGEALNSVPFHPRVVGAAEQLLGTTDLRLTQSLARATYCGPHTRDQQLHRDYHDNMLLTPPRRPARHDQLAVLIYLTDVGIGDAPTYVVGDRDAGDLPILPHHVSSDDDPELYAHEVPNVAPAGTALFYTLRTWHRGSAGTDPAGFRVVHHAVYREAGHDWIGFDAWPLRFDSEAGHRLIERLSPRQRELLGIPGPRDPFWTPETVAGFAARYPAADLGPYEPRDSPVE